MERFSAGALALALPEWSSSLTALPLAWPQDPRHKPPVRPVTAIVLGAGSRGNAYSNYSKQFPAELRIVGVAEPIPLRNERFARKFEIPDDKRFRTWEDVFKVPKFADAVFITTPDHLHHGPAMQALAMGYDLLLEKPVAQTWKQCKEILEQAKKHKRIVAVCHVLRYAPYFRKMRELVQSGSLGEIISVQHLEPVEHVHMSHSFVRGNWRNSRESNPMILAKSCHDADILLCILGKHCTRVASFGSLKWFRESNAPKGSTARCTDGCAVEAECPYSALRIYYRNRTWLHHMDLPLEGDQGPAILEHLKSGPYGRCVYRCDNDVVDHQVVVLEFEDAVTASFSMEAFTSYAGRRTRIMGSLGDLLGDEVELVYTDFRSRKQTRWSAREIAATHTGHGGGDFGLVRDWVQAVCQQDASLLSSTLDAAMESHLVCFKIEESRVRARVAEVKLDI
jgi:predicted dehydrogenase